MEAAFALAVISNRLVEALVAPVRKKYPELDLWWLVYVTWIVGGALSYLSGLNVLTVNVPDLPPLAGQLMTALLVGGGSQLLADAFKKPTA